MDKYSFKAVIFDLDGVITKTARVHAKAWKTVFDQYLKLREIKYGQPFKEFTHEQDYLPFIDGKPRYEGVKSFLASRNIDLPYGDPGDSTEAETVCGLGNRKNKVFREILHEEGAEVFTSTVSFIEKLKKAGVRVGVASSSNNCELILEATGLENLFETRVDGVVSSKLKLRGKPEGDIFVVAADQLGATSLNSVVVEDASSGVKAGRNGSFRLVIGVARRNNSAELLLAGADVVVKDLDEITPEWVDQWFQRKAGLLFESWQTKPKITETKKIHPYYQRLPQDIFSGSKRLIFFLDYDGTLTPIVARPDLAQLDQSMREVIQQLAEKHRVAIVSGRLRDDVQNLVKLNNLVYAGSHGFDIKGEGISLVHNKVKKIMPLVEQVVVRLRQKLDKLAGILIEGKKFSVAVHYRLVEESHLPQIETLVRQIVKEHPELRLMSGKKVFEILPNIPWNKGQAIKWIMKALKISWKDSEVVYIGDDVTDEYAFATVRTRGTAILVSDQDKLTTADFRLKNPQEVKQLFESILKKVS